MTRGDVAFVAGTWYAGVHAGADASSKFTLTVQRFDCPRDCSGRGECIHEQNGDANVRVRHRTARAVSGPGM